jgi:probable O-glycosylation ligase (exosortase A-associated)
MYLYYSTLLSLFLEYVRPGTDIQFIATSKITTILPLFLFCASLVVKTKNTHRDIWSSGNTRWLTFFMMLLIISWIASGFDLYTETKFEQALGYMFLFYFVSRFIDDYSKLKGLLTTLCFIHVYLIIRNSQIVLDPSVRHYLTGAPFLGDGNDFALSLCMTFPLCLYLWLEANSKLKRVIFGAMLMLIAFGVIGTQSRGASLGLLSILLYLWWDSRNKALGFMAIGVLVFLGLLFAPQEYFNRLETLQHYEEESSAKGRLDAWDHATVMALSSPVLGVGAGHFGLVHGLSAHSIYFLALAELGFPGLMFLLIYLFINFKRNKKNIKNVGKDPPKDLLQKRRLFLCLNGCVIGYAVPGAFLSLLYTPHMFILGAIMLVAHRINGGNQDGGGEVSNENANTPNGKFANSAFVASKN